MHIWQSIGIWPQISPKAKKGSKRIFAQGFQKTHMTWPQAVRNSLGVRNMPLLVSFFKSLGKNRKKIADNCIKSWIKNCGEQLNLPRSKVRPTDKCVTNEVQKKSEICFRGSWYTKTIFNTLIFFYFFNSPYYKSVTDRWTPT